MSSQLCTTQSKKLGVELKTKGNVRLGGQDTLAGVGKVGLAPGGGQQGPCQAVGALALVSAP